MNVQQLRNLIAHLPGDMDVRMYPSDVDELHVKVVGTFAASPHDRRKTLMLYDKRGEDFAAETIIYDETDGE